MNQLQKTYNQFYLFVCLVWPPLHYYIIRADGAGRTILVLSIIAILSNLTEFFKNKKVFSSPAFICWIALLCYSMWNVFTKGFHAEFGVFKFLRDNYFDTLVFLMVALSELVRDKEKTLRVIWSALGVFVLVGVPALGAGREGRLGAADLGNLYSLNVVCFLFVSSILFVERKISRGVLLVLIVGISMLVLLTGSRKSFGAEVIMLFGIVLNNRKKKDALSWIRIVLAGIILVYGIVYAMTHTVVGARILASSEEEVYFQLVENDKVNDFLMLVLGDRAIQYGLGLELFHEHFWTGIGLTNFMAASGYSCRIHSEYIVQLCENGIIGFALLVLFYVLIIRALKRSRRGDNKNKIGMAMTGLIALLFLNLTAWTYCQHYAMVVYAIVLMYAYGDSRPEKMTADYFENPILFRKIRKEEPPAWVQKRHRHRDRGPGDLLAVKRGLVVEEPVKKKTRRGSGWKWVVVILSVLVVGVGCYVVAVALPGFRGNAPAPSRKSVQVPQAAPVCERPVANSGSVEVTQQLMDTTVLDSMSTDTQGDNIQETAVEVFEEKGWTPYIEVFEGAGDAYGKGREDENTMRLVRKKLLDIRMEKKPVKKKII